MIEYRIQLYLRRFQDKQLSKPTHCQVCRKPGPLRWHGGYVRTLITRAKIHRLPIRRLLCAACHRTFAFLPDFICKFRRYAKTIIRYAVKKLATHTYDAVTDLLSQALPHTNLATRTLHYWRRQAV